MTRQRLTNDQWSIETNCFVCEPSNPDGLGLEFHRDGDRVTTSFRLGSTYSGAPNFVHGGVTLAILDEAMAWASIALGEKFAVTASTSTDFDGPVFVDHTYEVTAWLEGQTENEISARAEVRRDGATLVRSAARFVIVSEAVAIEAGATTAERELFRSGGDGLT